MLCFFKMQIVRLPSFSSDSEADWTGATKPPRFFESSRLLLERDGGIFWLPWLFSRSLHKRSVLPLTDSSLMRWCTFYHRPLPHAAVYRHPALVFRRAHSMDATVKDETVI